MMPFAQPKPAAALSVAARPPILTGADRFRLRARELREVATRSLRD